MFELPFDAFMDRIAPFSPSDSLINKCLSRLKDNGLADCLDGRWTFTAFKFLDPSTGQQGLQTALRDICDCICDRICSCRHLPHIFRKSAVLQVLLLCTPAALASASPSRQELASTFTRLS